ncbi:MAG: hypothetical protein NT118_03310 [Lentisphaerae bacterium]|nr:hypothetical protein [Lentisphaerota bacterium]
MLQTQKAPPKGEEREITSFSTVKNGHDSGNFSFAVVENFPSEFAAIDVSLKKTDVFSEDGEFVADCALAFNNASQTSRKVILLLELIGDNPTQKSVPLVLQQGTMEKRVPLTIKKCGKSLLKLSLTDSETGKLLSFSYNEVDLKYVPLRVAVVQPRYKNAIFSNQEVNELIFDIETSIGEKERAFCKLEFDLKDASGKTITAKEAGVSGGLQDKFIVPVPGLADGNYTMRIKLVHKKTNAVLGEWENCLRKLPYQKGQVNINKDGMVFVDNKPFVPFGLGSFGTGCSLIWESYDFGCNTIHSSLRLADEDLPFLAAVEKADMKVIVYGVPPSITVPCFNNTKGISDRPLTKQERQVLSEYINKYKNQASILSWYTANEPAEPNVSPEIMRDIDEIISAQDPYHPAKSIINSMGDLPVFSKYTDIVMPDPYPVMMEAGGWKFPNGPADAVSDSKKLTFGIKPIWVVLESFDWRLFGGLHGKNRCPNFNDLRCQFFQSLAAGATGFFWYCRPWMNPDVGIGLKYLSKETKVLEDVILTPQSKKMFKSPDAGEKGNDVSLHISRRDSGNQTYFFAASSSIEPTKHTFVADLQGEKLYVAGESRTVQLKDGVIKGH